MKRYPFSYALILLATSHAWADEAVLRHDILLAHTLSQSSQASALDANFAEKLSEAIQEEIAANPEVSAELRTPTDAGTETSFEITLSKTFRQGDFGLRKALAESIRAAATAEKRQGLLELSEELSALFLRVWSIQEQRKTLLKGRQRAFGIREKLLRATEQGLLPLGDERVFAAEGKKLGADEFGLLAEEQATRQELQRLSQFPIESRPFARPEVPPLISKSSLLEKVRGGKLPAQEKSKLLALSAEKHMALARAERTPALTPHFGFERTEEGNHDFLLGIQIPLPFSDRNQASIEKARASASIRTQEQQYFNGPLFESELAYLWDSIQALSKQAEEYEDSVVPALTDALKHIEAQFQRGQGNVVQVWQAQRELTEAQTKSIELNERALLVQLKLQTIIGE